MCEQTLTKAGLNVLFELFSIYDSTLLGYDVVSVNGYRRFQRTCYLHLQGSGSVKQTFVVKVSNHSRNNEASYPKRHESYSQNFSNKAVRINLVNVYYINKPTRCTFCMYLFYNFCTTLHVSNDHFFHHQKFMIYCILQQCTNHVNVSNCE